MMMIRINLLPVRQVKKREMGRQMLVLFAAVLVLGVVLNYLWYSSEEAALERERASLAEIRSRIQKFEKEIGEVNNINKRQKEVEAKLKILDDLKRGRAGPVKMLDALATAMPKRVWLRSFDEKGGKVSLNGSALSHDDVADLMRALTTMVWTPRGMGRLVEVRKDTKTSRVELLGGEGGSVEDFSSSEVKSFFTNVDLARSSATGSGSARRVEFQISLAADYLI